MYVLITYSLNFMTIVLYIKKLLIFIHLKPKISLHFKIISTLKPFNISLKYLISFAYEIKEATHAPSLGQFPPPYFPPLTTIPFSTGTYKPRPVIHCKRRETVFPLACPLQRGTATRCPRTCLTQWQRLKAKSQINASKAKQSKCECECECGKWVKCGLG